MLKKITALLLLCCSLAAGAQTFLPGQVLTAGALNAALAAKTDNAAAAITSGTITGLSAPLPVASGGTGASTATAATDQLQFLQGATGSAARSVAAKLKDIPSVLDFAGVDPTGATDSAAGIQAAINAVCTAGGGTLHFPPGTYKVGTLLTATCSGFYIRGAGMAATTITSASATAGVFAFSAPQLQGLSDLLISASVTQTAGSAVTVSGVRGFTMERVKIDGAYTAINIAGGVIQYYTDLEILNSVHVAIYINGGNDQFLKNIVADAPAGAQPLAGIRINKTDAVWMDSVDMIHQGTGLLVDPQGATDYVTWLFVSNSAFDTGSGPGINLAPAHASSYVIGSTFVGSWTSTNLFGFYIGGVGKVDGVRVVGHRAFNNAQSGYVIASGGSRGNISINDSDAAGNSTASPGTYSGFDVASGVSGFSITASRSGQQANFSNTQSRGILVNPGASDNYLIVGNDLRGNVNASLLDLGTGTTKTIGYNLGVSPTIDNTPIGATTPSTAAFTTLTSNGLTTTADTNTQVTLGRYSAGYGGSAITTGGTATFLSLQVAGAEMLRLSSGLANVTGAVNASNAILSSSATAGVGYTTGAGGTVAQATSKTTGATLNTVTGQITMNSAALAAAATACFTLTNSALAATDVVNAVISSGATAGAYTLQVDAVAAGSARMCLNNRSAGSLSEAVVINFAVLKGSAN